MKKSESNKSGSCADWSSNQLPQYPNKIHKYYALCIFFWKLGGDFTGKQTFSKDG